MRVSKSLTLLVGAVSAYDDYCKSSESIDIIVLAFLDNLGGGNYPNGQDVGGCSIDKNGNTSGCDNIVNGINAYHAAGKKVFICLGGAGSNYKLTSTADGRGVACSLWNSYARPSATSNSPRPLGNAYIDSWDFDLESNDGSQAYLGSLINALRGYFSKDSSHTYYISGAPQCPIPEGNMGNSLMQSKYDYLFIQFYNNNCAAAELARPGGHTDPNIGNAKYNLASWPGYLSGGSSSGAKLLVGLPGSTKAATNYDYIGTNELPTVVSNSKGVSGFGGVMLFDAGSSDSVYVNGCHYAQQVRRVLDTGKSC